jgi:type IV pilus assembly protein PilC
MAELAYRTKGAAGGHVNVWQAVADVVRDAFNSWRRRVPSAQLVLVTSQLSLMLETGNTISESLSALGQQTEGTKMGAVLDNVASSVAGGRTLTAALDEHPAVFPKLYISAVRAGETSGRLSQIFKRLELHMTKRAELREGIRSALTYPAILSVMLLGVVVFAMTFVLPRFTAIFENAGVVLPIPTRILMAGGTLTKRYWYLIPVFVLLAAFGILWLFRNARCKNFIDGVLLRIPVLGALLKGISTSSLVRTLGMLLESGVPLTESIDVAKDSVVSHSFRQFMDELERSVLQGDGFAAPFRDSDLMSPVDQQMAATGDKTGSLPTVMTRLADHHDEQVEVKLKRLTAIVEPMFIAIMGLFVGFVAMAVLLPLFKMASALRVGA